MSRIKNRFSSLCVITLLIIIAAGGTSDLRSEHVFLKDGSIVNGAIVRDAAATITLKNAGGKFETIPRGKILRILYTAMKMGKIHVQMRDGKGFEAFIVDEDQNTYTMRKDLTSPRELTVPRTDVLFIAERNPSGLKGTPDTAEIALTWYPPYNPVRHYLIYHKARNEKNFRPAIKSSRTHLTVEDLKSNTAYIFKTTAVDHSNEESIPSNELTLTTKNIPPSRPGNVEKQLEPTGALRLSWDNAADADGKVVKYKLYATAEGARIPAGETVKTSHTVQDSSRYKYLEVTALDNLGDESVPARIRISGGGYSSGITAGIIFPMGNFGDLAGLGYGGSLSFTKHDLFIYDLDAGISAGFYHMPGMDDIGTEIHSTERAFFVPVSLTASYRFAAIKKLSIAPHVSLGAGYLDMPYTERDSNTLFDTEKHLKTFGPMAAAGLSFEYSASRSFYFGLRSEMGLFIRTEIFEYPFIRFDITGGYRL